jgi:hypothetical protein
MPVNRLIFQDAETARNRITLEQRKDIKRLYSDWAHEVAGKATYYHHKSTGSAPLSEHYYRELEDSLITASERVAMTGVCRKSKSAGFQPFEPYRKTIAVPVEDFHERVVTIEKDEKVIAERIGLKHITDDGDEPIEGFSHIDGSGTEGEAGMGRYR